MKQKKKRSNLGEIIAYAIMMALIIAAYTPIGDISLAELWGYIQALIGYRA